MVQPPPASWRAHHRIDHVRHPRHSSRLRHPTGVARRFRPTAAGPGSLNYYHHHNHHAGHDASRGGWQPWQCPGYHGRAHRQHHRCDGRPAGAPSGGRAGATIPQVCLGSQATGRGATIAMNGWPVIGNCREFERRVGHPKVGTTRECLQVR